MKSVVVVHCCGYSLKRTVALPKKMVVKMCSFCLIYKLVFVNICTPCRYLHPSLDDSSSVFYSTYIYICLKYIIVGHACVTRCRQMWHIPL
jgi:hypothetical protein